MAKQRLKSCTRHLLERDQVTHITFRCSLTLLSNIPVLLACSHLMVLMWRALSGYNVFMCFKKPTYIPVEWSVQLHISLHMQVSCDLPTLQNHFFVSFSLAIFAVHTLYLSHLGWGFCGLTFGHKVDNYNFFSLTTNSTYLISGWQLCGSETVHR